MSMAMADVGMFEERYEPGLAQSVGLAVAVHVVLAVVLFFGVRWQSKPPEAVSVELWSPPPPVVVQQPEPPKPQPRVEAPPPKPEPVIEKPEIALKEPAKPKPKPEPPKAEAKPKPVPPKPAPPKPAPVVLDDPMKKLMMEQLAREERSIQVDRERTSLNQQLQNDANSKALASWVDKVRLKVRGNMIVLPDVVGNPEAVFEIVQLPTGEVLNVKLKKSSGNAALDDAIERAVKKSSPLPRPDRPELLPRTFELKYRPRD